MTFVKTLESQDISSSPKEHYIGLLPPQETRYKNFIQFVFGQPILYRFLFILLLVVQIAVFKIFYPFPDFFSDSYSYIEVAINHDIVNLWPVGYSWFLRFVHVFSHSSTVLVLFQFALLELAALYLYKTIFWFYPGSSYARNILFVLFFFNPVNLYFANYVSSESLFLTLSLLWITELIWIINKPSKGHAIFLSVIFFIAFTVRYNALIYPIITAIAFILSKQKLGDKILGITLGPIFTIPFILIVATEAKRITGEAQFPPIYGGWQWANNALYIREYISEDTTKFPSKQMAELDSIARSYFLHVPPERRELVFYVGNFFVKQWDAPLKIYMLKEYKTSGMNSWAKVSPLFDQYGKYIIKRHPYAFFKHYLLVNSLNYIYPPLEKLELYNIGMDEMWYPAIIWFDYHSKDVKVVSKTLQGYLLFWLPGFFLLLNLYNIWLLISFVRKGGLKSLYRSFNKLVMVLAVFLFLNCIFSIYANIICMRYQIFPLVIQFILALLLTDYLELYANKLKLSKTKD